MRSIVATILFLILLAWIGCVMPAPPTAANARNDASSSPDAGAAIWRRTNRGWERADDWPPFRTGPASVSPAPAPAHPLSVAGLILVGSLTALSALAPDSQRS